MAGTHGDLYREIGKLVLAAHAGQTIDLDKKSRELAHRYWKLGVPPETIARAIARSLGAVSVSMAVVRPEATNGAAPTVVAPIEKADPASSSPADEPDGEAVKSPTALFPSGVRLAVLS
jgi:hypothetical protein